MITPASTTVVVEMHTVNTKYVVARSRCTIGMSLARIEASTCSMARPWKRRPHPIRGGSSHDFDGAPHHLRARILCFVNTTELPRIVAGYAMEPKPCDVCRQPIPRGSPEYDIGFSGLAFRLDADCYAIWTEEMLRSSTEPRSA